ncbi:LacI family DNA-binding transcriptional regulator [Isoptericola variabilis]|uniref:Transcriptional regulator, LacI family n=1 Tax=Isoptericola variabilis (strain 225) TaxID=743718 RepID=F6FX66_ISOV2|nr:LacI family DNA-binding transcriptional regulator [Isoptericola variabilis]AEG43569.1 transcriptional regulator, LacI family [Isoptericola variabilis 225]TWH32063.1 LacI family transcriptional regulator [Isoptericola variabilis J7]
MSGPAAPGRAAARVRRPSMADVAAVAGVSHQTVSRVLNAHPSVRGETRERVLQAIESLGYRRNSAARALATARSATLGVVTTGSALFGPTSTLVAVEGAARDEGYFVSVATLRTYDAAAMHEALEHFMAQGVEGIVVIAPQDDVAAAVESFRAPVPVVVVAALEDAESAPGGPATLSLAVDQRSGARLATDHLLDLGHHDVVHVAGPQDWFDARERAAGWREALEARGVTPTRPRVCSWSADDGYAAGRDLAEAVGAGEGPTAVLAGNDQLALGILRALWERGLDVPGDVSVVGFDDVAGAAYFVPPLTTVRQPFARLGARAVAMVLAALAGGDVPPERIAPELVVRSSTGAPCSG